MLKHLLRTNPLLTTNYKIVVSSDDLIYLESYNANNTLADIKYKHFTVPTNSWLSERLSTFYKNLSKDIAYSLPEFNNIFENDYKNQYNDIYWGGAKNVEDSYYKEKKEFTAPIMLDGTELPSNFLIYRINLNPFDTKITDYSNFENKLNNLILVKNIDLINSNFGSFLKRNIIDNKNFPQEALTINLDKYEFSKWNGINYLSGGFTSNSLFAGDDFNADSIHSDTEMFLTNGFKNSGVICSNILNIKFLFDDYQIKINNSNVLESIDFSMNQYIGFYVKSLNKIISYSPYINYEFNKDLWIVDNVFRLSNDKLSDSVNPLKNINWPNNKVFIKINDEFKEIVFINNEYKILDNKIYNLKVDDIVSDVPVKIDIDTSDGYAKYRMYTPSYTFPFKWNAINSDFLLIKINNKFYNCKPIIQNNTIIGYNIYSDDYLFADGTKTIIKNLNSEHIFNNTVENKPIEFELYYADVVDIHDLDFNFIKTDYAKYDYDKKDIFFKTPFPKIQSEITDIQYNYNINNNLITVNGNTFTAVNKYTDYSNGTFEISSLSTTPEKLPSSDITFSLNTNLSNVLNGNKSLKVTINPNIATSELFIKFPFLPEKNTTYKVSFNVKVPYIERDDNAVEMNLIYEGYDDAIINNIDNYLRFDAIDNKFYNLSYILNIKENITGKIILKFNIYPDGLRIFDIYIDDITINAINPVLSINSNDIPYTSEYFTGKDLYLNNTNLLWNINPWITKWGFKDSIGHSNYPYKFNVSSKISGYNNFEPSLKSNIPDENYFNLNWFYIFGEPRKETLNLNNTKTYNVAYPHRYALQYYDYHSLHLSPYNIDYKYKIDDYFWSNQYFDINAHQNIKEYFDIIFNNDYKFETKIKESVLKYSLLRKSDDVNTSYTLFKGLKYNFWLSKNGKLYSDTTLVNTKFSIVLSKRPTENSALWGKCGGTFSISRKSNSIVFVIWFYCPINSLTSIESVHINNLYKGTIIYNTKNMNEQIINNYCYDLNIFTNVNEHTDIKLSNLTPEKLTLANIFNYINGYSNNFDYPIEYISDDNNEYYITVQGPNEFIIDNMSYNISESDVNIDVYNKAVNNSILTVKDDLYIPFINTKTYYNYNKINRSYEELYDLNTSSKIERFSGSYMPITKKIDIFSDKNINYVLPQFESDNTYFTLSNIDLNKNTADLNINLENDLRKFISINMTLYLDSKNKSYDNNTNLNLNKNMLLTPFWCNNKFYTIKDITYNKSTNITSIVIDNVNIYKINSNLIDGQEFTNFTTYNRFELYNKFIIDQNNKIFNVFYTNISTTNNFNYNIKNNSSVWLYDFLTNKNNTYNYSGVIFNNTDIKEFWCKKQDLFYGSITGYKEGNPNFAKTTLLINRIAKNFTPKSSISNIEANLPIISEVKTDYIDFNIFSSNYEIGFYKKTIFNKYIV